MRKLSLTLLIVFLPILLFAQYDYEPSKEYPYGRVNPDAPRETADYQKLIGRSDCNSETRKQDGTWAESQKIIWEFKYILNGFGVQDRTLKPDGSHSGSIRQYIADSSAWFVHYFSNSSPSTTLPAWKGGMVGDEIILYRDQKAPNGMEGSYKITFKDITDEGFNWLGAWVDKAETIVYPTWKIQCTKRKD